MLFFSLEVQLQQNAGHPSSIQLLLIKVILKTIELRLFVFDNTILLLYRNDIRNFFFECKQINLTKTCIVNITDIPLLLLLLIKIIRTFNNNKKRLRFAH